MATYLQSLGIITPIITSKFLQDGCPFLLGAKRQIVQIHFHSRLTLGGLVTFYLQLLKFPSHHLSNYKKKVDCFEENILENMLKHSFSSIVSELFSNYHCAWLKSYAGSGLGVWFFAHPIIPCFKMAFDIFSLTLCIKLGLPHPKACGLSQFICGQAINLIGIHLLHYVHGGKRTTTHDAIQDSFTPIARDVGFHVSHEQTHVLPMPTLQSSQ